jgi:hypothetical protein
MLRLTPALLPYSMGLLIVLVGLDLVLSMIKLAETPGIKAFEVFLTPIASLAVMFAILFCVQKTKCVNPNA